MVNVTAVCVLWNSRDMLPILAETLEGLSGLCSLLLVDNGSSDGSPDEAKRLIPGAEVIETGRNGGFGWGNNRALERVQTPFTLLLNTDARIAPDSLGELVEALSADQGAAAAQPVLRSWDWPLLCVGEGGTMTRFGEGYDMRFLHLDPGLRAGEPKRVPVVSAAVSLWRTEALRKAGGFDENIFMYFEDVDLCMRLASEGWRFLLAPGGSALHRAGASSTRREALAWELESSVYLTRRFFGSGRCVLPGYWRRRELRIRLSNLRRGIPWTWRISAVRKGRALSCTPFVLPGEVLSMLESRPLDMPMPRWKDAGVLDDSGLVHSGPGFHREGGRLLFTGYGCLRISKPGRITLRISTPGRARSGAVLDPAGNALSRFNTHPCEPISVAVTATLASSRLYVSLDERHAVAEVLDVSMEEC